MPLLRDMKVDPDLCGDSFRRKEFVVQGDFVRRIELGNDVSIRTQSMKGTILIKTLREISEPDVQITNDIQEAYANAEDWLCRKMCDLFKLATTLSIHPEQFDKTITFQRHGGDPIALRANQLAWLPVASFYVGDERVYLWRVLGLRDASGGTTWNMANTGCVGFTKDYMNKLAPELAAYVTRFEGKAMNDENVKNAFGLLGAMLRPAQHKAEMEEERAKAYEGKEFGGWA